MVAAASGVVIVLVLLWAVVRVAHDPSEEHLVRYGPKSTPGAPR